MSQRLHWRLCVYKVFWPPETTIQLGKKIIAMKDFTPWPPPEQIGMDIDVPTKQEERKQDMG